MYAIQCNLSVLGLCASFRASYTSFLYGTGNFYVYYMYVGREANTAQEFALIVLR